MNGKAGFTLLEVLAAVLIFSVGSLAVASMQISAISGNNASGTMTEAGIWAADKMEELLSRDFTDAELQDTDGDGTDQDLDSDWVDDDGGNFGLEHRANPGSDGQPNNDTTDSQADFQETQRSQRRREPAKETRNFWLGTLGTAIYLRRDALRRAHRALLFRVAHASRAVRALGTRIVRSRESP